MQASHNLTEMYYGTQNTYLIYPSNWKDSWGEKPFLGLVKADSIYWAKYAAYDEGLVPFNSTFDPYPVLLTRDMVIPRKQSAKRQ